MTQEQIDELAVGIYHRFVNYEWNDVSEQLEKSIIAAINEGLKVGQSSTSQPSKEGGQQDIPMDKDGWIRVEDKPEQGVEVLIFEPPSNIQVSYWNGRKPRGERVWYEWPNGQDDQPSGYYPTHWQPLPFPPTQPL